MAVANPAADTTGGGTALPVADTPAPAARTWTVLIAALGGEGGGVLSNWIVDAAMVDGRQVQATSVPGVAQRTGATTYYLEIGTRDDSGEPESGAQDGEAPPRRVMALLPTPGNVDLLVASELLEAGRAAERGMITPERTTVIASTHRTFAIAEKSAMGDGRFEDERVRQAVRELAHRCVLTDLGRVAERAGTVLSSVLLGAIAGSGVLPIPARGLRAAIERGGIAVEANLRGFDAGVRLFETTAEDGDETPTQAGVDAPREDEESAATPGLSPELITRLEALPAPMRDIARAGAERALDWQDERYAALYLQRLEQLLERAGASPVPDLAQYHAALAETARHLALRMCFEDIVRVADLKTRRSRLERVRAEVRAAPEQPVRITEFLKPGMDEWCSLLPSWLARPLLAAAERGGWRHRVNVGLHIRTSSISGFLLLWLLARSRWLRRRTHRYREEQAHIEGWLSHVGRAFETGPDFALETARCANLVKGYSDTHRRGLENFARVMACLPACTAAPEPATALRALREAALADPEGDTLAHAIAALATDPALSSDKRA